MRVLFYDIEPKLPLGNAHAVASLNQLLHESDIITLHVPETEQTKQLIGAAEIAALKPTSSLINTSRGQVVDIEELARALREGRLRSAAIDVFPVEPPSNELPFESPLQGLDNVILTPHIGGSTAEAQEKIAAEVSGKLINFCSFGSSTGSVNFPELTLAPHVNSHRLLHIHHNVPGILSQINQAIADAKINVEGQHLLTNTKLGYAVLDIEKGPTKQVLSTLERIEGTIKTGILY
jgi:D-3-phosphoglycerate dehydrogenase